MEKKLTDRQQRFVDEYLISLNATDAARKSGYSERTAQEQASRLLSNVIVAAAIRKAQAGLQRRTQVTQEMVVHELAKIAFDNVTDPDTKMAYRDQHKMKALELIGKHLGMYTDKIDMRVTSVEQLLAEMEDDE